MIDNCDDMVRGWLKWMHWQPPFSAGRCLHECHLNYRVRWFAGWVCGCGGVGVCVGGWVCGGGGALSSSFFHTHTHHGTHVCFLLSMYTAGEEVEEAEEEPSTLGQHYISLHRVAAAATQGVARAVPAVAGNSAGA